eukprot:GHVU01158026.1.p1 GENE.GHVU01158026.1~~GHVU01158026.1.p1  ORF type:complete len:318 (+),score=48.70 GHVU01158026.1:120-1073(+)
MSTTHPTKITTEWHDLQVKYGNFEKLEEEVKEEELTKAAIDAAEQIDPLQNKSLAELDELEDDLDDDVLRRYRETRKAEMEAARKRERFGELYEINKSEYTREVTEASKTCVVVVLLFESGADGSDHMKAMSRRVAERYKAIKFVVGDMSQIVESKSKGDRGSKGLGSPLVLLYRAGHCVKQINGLNEWVAACEDPDTPSTRCAPKTWKDIDVHSMYRVLYKNGVFVRFTEDGEGEMDYTEDARKKVAPRGPDERGDEHRDDADSDSERERQMRARRVNVSMNTQRMYRQEEECNDREGEDDREYMSTRLKGKFIRY